ncbi:MAG TPA: hypothetical protein VKQ30_03605 [Ktedonobacterales bacterium]|nr:hypothetical protein [Ktedonobacterales bacterium]
MMPPGQPASPFMPPAMPGDYPTTVAGPYPDPASSPTPPAMPAINVPPGGQGYPYANPPAPASPMTPLMTPPVSGPGYSPYPGQPMPSAPAPYPYPGAGMPPPPRRQNNTVVIGAIAALVIIVVAAGIAFALSQRPTGLSVAGSTPTATTPPTATTAPTATIGTSANQVQFTDPNNFYSIGVPSEWTQTNKSSGSATEEVFQDPQTGARAAVAYLSGTQSGQTTDDQFLGGVGNISNKQSPTTITQAGETWTKEEADTTASGQTVHIAVLATTHGGKTVVVAFFASADSFDTTSTTVFEPMFASFQFNA